jgi:hypothetical protein
VDERFFTAFLVGSSVATIPPSRYEPFQRLSCYRPWVSDDADAIVSSAVRQLVIVSYDAVKAFGTQIKRRDEVLANPAVALCKHLRHAFAHNGRWDLSRGYAGSIQWGSISLDREIHRDRPVEELVSLQDMLELSHVLADWLSSDAS